MNYKEYLIMANILTPGYLQGHYKNTECRIIHQTNFNKTKRKEKAINIKRWPNCTETEAKIRTQNDFNLTNKYYEIHSDEEIKPKKKAIWN